MDDSGKIRQEQLQTLLRCMGDLNQLMQVDDFHQHAAKSLRPLLGGDWIASETYLRWPLVREKGYIDQIPQGLLEVFVERAAEHPFLDDMDRFWVQSKVHVLHHQPGDVQRFMKMPLYNEFYRKLEIIDQACLPCVGEEGELSVLTYSRDTPYREDEVALLKLLRPHYAQAYRNWSALQKAGIDQAWVEDGLEALGSAVVLLNRRGQPVRHTASALQLIETYFDFKRDDVGLLPKAVQEWVRLHISLDPSGFTAPPPWVVKKAEGEGASRVTLRLLPAPEQQGYLLLLEKHTAVPSAQMLEHRFGLSPQRSRVLSLLANGQTTTQIADALGLKPGTVRKHLEHAYRTLGVHSRAKAISKVLAE